MTIFYSWQTDVGRQTNRYLIKGALTQAIANLKTNHATEVMLDEATRDAVGAVHIPENIFPKIDVCSAFVADISIVAQFGTEPKKYSPNPNVLIELGYAAKVLSQWEQITLVYNSAFCMPDGKKPELKAVLPFDLGFRRILDYHLPESATGSERKRKEQELAKDLTTDLLKKLARSRRVSVVPPNLAAENLLSILRECKMRWDLERESTGSLEAAANILKKLADHLTEFLVARQDVLGETDQSEVRAALQQVKILASQPRSQGSAKKYWSDGDVIFQCLKDEYERLEKL